VIVRRRTFRTAARRAALVASAILLPASLTGALPAQEQEPPRATSGAVSFRARLASDTVYVGEQASYDLVVTIPADVRQRLRRNPQFVPPETRGMLAYDLPVPKRDPTRDGPEVHVFRRALFPLTAGRHGIPAARLAYALPQSASFFSREEERTLRSEGLTLVAVDPPAAGRPADWGGAVGSWRAEARADAGGARVGDPFVLTLRLAGTGNATLLPRPELRIAWANVVPEDERVVLDSTPTTLGGSKEFTWLVTPREPGAHAVPGFAYPYFDPEARRYVMARTGPIPVRVRAGDLVTIPPRPAAGPAAVAPLALRPAPAGTPRRTFPAAELLLWFGVVAPLPWVAARWRSRRPAAPRPRTPTERLEAEPDASPGRMRALYDAALRQRTGIALESVTDTGALGAALRREGVTAETASEAERLRDALDAAAYATASAQRPAAAELRARVRAVLDRVGAEARRAAPLLLLSLALSGAGCAAVPAADERALVAFTEGQTAYAGQDYRRARDAFLRAANAAPRDAAAWANLGTAAWQAGDTAAAVLGWQRALRLEPLAGDVRARLARVRAPQTRGAARVWPLPVAPLALLAVLLWTAGWAWSARRRWRRRTARRAAVLLVPALLLSALALLAERQARAGDLAVIATSVPLRSLPALGAEPGAVPLVGEVVRVRERRGVWLRLQLDAARAGWYPAANTYPLARD
jgi:tetratricopeptide (TPR) repeat protein